MIKLLWVDDNLDQDLLEKRLALLMVDDFDPHFARDATEALYRLRKENFDVVIFDLRLPAGADNIWNDYRQSGFQKFGFLLLNMVANNLYTDFNHLRQTRFGVFSIELPEENPELFEDPINLPRINFKMKTHAYYETAFIEFVRQVHRSTWH